MLSFNDKNIWTLTVDDLQFPLTVSLPGYQVVKIYDRDTLDALEALTSRAIELLDLPTEDV